MNLESSKPRTKVRELSDFMCKEMLYDYASRNLDASRAVAVENHLKKQKHLQKDLENLEHALTYCDQLAQTQISTEFVDMVDEQASSQVMALISKAKWQFLPEQFKWGVQALSLALVAGTLIYILPWQNIKKFIPEKVESERIETTEVQNQQLAEITTPPTNEKVPPAESDQSVLPTEPSTQVAANSGDAEAPAATPVDLTPKTETATTETIKEPIKEETKTPPKSEVEVADTKTKKDIKKTVVQGSQAQFKGELYRAFMSHEDIDKITPEVVDKIMALGGEKAGDVKLGWRKVDGSYFHLTLDEKNYDTLLSYLQTFSPVRIYKDPHWRVMPQGKIRIILWIEDKKFKK